MKQVFVFCVGLIVVAEIVLWNAQTQFWQLVVGVQLFFVAFNLMEALLPSLISKESPAGYKGTAMVFTPPASFLAWRLAVRWAAGLTACLTVRGISRWRNAGRSVAGSRQYHERTAVCQQFAH